MMKRGILAVLIVWSLVLTGTLAAQRPAAEHWVGTWATAPVSVPSQPGGPPQLGAAGPPPSVNNQTLRQIVHTSLGGDRVRVVLTNAFGTGRLAIGGAHIALRDKGGAIVDGSDHVLTFGGAATMSIPPGGLIVSDPTNLRVPAMGDLAIDVYLPGDTAASPSPLTMHTGARQTNYISSTGNHLGMKELPGATTTPSWFFLSRVEVTAPAQAAAIVTFGDSITDGYNSTPDTNNRWPDHLARRLMSGGGGFGVLNLGIDGNRVLNEIAGPAALARFDRDVLGAPGVTHVFVLEGINDLGISSLLNDGNRPTPEQLIAGHRQLIARAHAKGLRIFASTLLPYEATAIPGYYNEEGEKVRQAFNEWMRTAKEYDGFVDFDQVMRDPSHPAKMLEKYDSGDHLHPNDAGYQAMANAFNLAFVKEGAKGSSGR
jgi:lysophospholipase L1-like esterase